jgi:hypothetical protein
MEYPLLKDVDCPFVAETATGEQICRSGRFGAAGRLFFWVRYLPGRVMKRRSFRIPSSHCQE